ncbi:carbohydrate kinase family protein [Paenibacillus hexagrammi]|uniref:Carbohydrate kinase n=1 Tax=Paenibacillus hexagrammi TaxID=2908839 RepID=A0ABY3SEH4_9BACL|nr:carbohydrate kinase [Paenibacillus sp. YPD9-1]UJF32393.1 carbohydrate kinase [Paenibacillus sp. YPD9-1]
MEAVAIGELLIDFTPEGRGDGKEGHVAFLRNPGGAPANVMAALTKWGIQTAMIAKIGDDPLGHYLKGVLQEAGVNTDGVVLTQEAPTTLAFVHLDKTGDRSFHFYRNPGADCLLRPEEINRDQITRARIFHYGSISKTHEPAASATRYAVRTAKESGALISYDPNLRLPLWESETCAKQTLLEGFSDADILKLSEEELLFLTGINDPIEGTKYIYDTYGTRLILITLGALGSFYRYGTLFGIHPGFQVEVVDTTGAGDAFLAGVLFCVLEKGGIDGWSKGELERLLSFANASGALTTCSKGAIPALPSVTAIRNLTME